METYDNKTDAELVSGMASDVRFLGVLIERYQNKIDAYISRRSGASREDRKDILQNIFIKIYRHANEFNPEIPFSSWLYRIARNETIDWYRKRSRQPSVSLETNISILESVASEFNIAEDIINKEEAQGIRDAVASLPEEYREIIELRFFEEKEYTEIADILKIPMGTIATKIHRAKKRLQEIMKSKKNEQR